MPSTPATSPTILPRPLQLIDGSVPSTPVTSGSSILSPTRSTYSSPAGLPTPPTTTRRPASANPRRQSSISYFPSDHVSIRSPTSSAFSSFRPSVKRSNSLGIRAGEILLSREARDRRSLGSETSPVGDKAPLTLTEKHADLLQFIAQKESKCMELRTQLAIHEEELAHLKQKWERIVSRGMDRAYTPSFPSHNMPSSSAHSSSPGLAASLLNSTNVPVLDGIKEGVQGVGRLLAAGLDLSASGSPSTSSPSATTSIGPGMSSVSRAALAPAIRRAKHGTTQSVSSVSTSGTASSSAVSAGTRLSQSSASSLSLPEDEEDRLLEQDEDKTIHQDSVPGSLEQLMSSEAPISPSTATKSAKLLRRRSREVPKVSPSASSNPNPSSPLSPNASQKSKTNRPTFDGFSATSATPVSSWVGSVGSSVGKKWEEIQKTETFTKSQKRASLLLSDVSQSIFAALASPAVHSPSNPSRTSKPSQLSISTNANSFAPTISPLSATPSPQPSGSSLLEDDEDELQGTQGGRELGDVLVPVSLSKSQTFGDAKPTAKEPVTTQAASTSSVDGDEEWNW